MLEESQNSMVNMAISLDPLTANRVLGKVDQKAMDKQKKALKQNFDKIYPD